MARQDRVYRARQLIIEHPNWGRRRINAKLREEYGKGLRDAVVDRLTAPQREVRAAGLTPVFESTHPRPSRLQQVMKRAGFLKFEIEGVPGSPAVGLGQIAPDSWHPLFRQVMERLIRSRYDEFRRFLNRADRAGLSPAKARARWRKQVLRHYRDGRFPGVGQAVARGGKLLTPSGDPSPWALYKIIESHLIQDEPFGGQAWGTPRPVRQRKDFVPTPVSSSSIKREIEQRQRWLQELDTNITRARNRGDERQAKQYEKQRANIRQTVTKLERKLQ